MTKQLFNSILRHVAPAEIYEQSNPVFHLRYAHEDDIPTVEQLIMRTRRPIFFVGTIILIGWGITVLPQLVSKLRGDANIEPLMIIFGYLMISIWINLALDNDSVSATLECAARWTRKYNPRMIHTALFRADDFVNAKHAMAQIHVWSRMIGVMAFRAILILLLWTDVLLFSRSLPDEPLRVLFHVVFVLAVCITFVLEPLYRVRAMTALGIIVNSGGNLFPGLQAWVAIVAVWVAQVAGAGLILMLISWVVRPLYGTTTFAQELEFLLDWVLLLAWFFIMYQWIQNTALEKAIQNYEQ